MAAMKSLKLVRDRSGAVIPNSTQAPGYVDIRVLAANTAESHTVPAGAKFVLITVTGNTFINIGGTAAVAAADVTNGSASLLMVNTAPRLFALNGAAAIGVIASAIQTVVLEFFA
jgi:hypothetical protein